MSDNKKPREWTIENNRFQVGDNNFEVIQIASGLAIGRHEKVKVIEYSAYQALEDKLKAAEASHPNNLSNYLKLEQTNKELIEALQAIGNINFIADRGWAISRAREVLKKYGLYKDEPNT